HNSEPSRHPITTPPGINAKAIIHFDVYNTSDVFLAHFDLTDSGQVLNTGGFDRAFDGTNESLGWRDVGTTGIADPAGDQAAPEPTSAILLAMTLLGAAGYVRSRRRLA